MFLEFLLFGLQNSKIVFENRIHTIYQMHNRCELNEFGKIKYYMNCLSKTPYIIDQFSNSSINFLKFVNMSKTY